MTSYKDKYVNGRLHQLKSNCCSVGYDCFYRLYDKKSQWDDIRGELHEPEFELSG